MLKRFAKSKFARVLVVLMVLALGLIYACRCVKEVFNCRLLQGDLNSTEVNYNFEWVRHSLTPQWTPDGTRIVFVAEGQAVADADEEYIYPQQYPTRWILVVAADGSSLWTISDLRTEFVLDGSPRISPDGARVAYSTYNQLNNYKRYFDIETAALDGSDRKRLTRKSGLDMAPEWLPNSNLITFRREASSACAHDFSDSGIYTMNLDGSGIRRVLPEKGVGPDKYYGEWAWSPDERRIAVMEQIGNPHPSFSIVNQTALDVVNADGSSRKRLLDGKARLFTPAWSPDGARIAFISLGDGNAKLLTVDSDGGGLGEIADVPETSMSLSWSPDGSQIMYVSATYDLYLVETNGSDVRHVGKGLYADWSPDGSRIAVESPHLLRDDHSGVVLYTAAPDGSDVQVLVRLYAGRLWAVGPDQRSSADVASCSAGVVVSDPESNSGLVRDCQALVKLLDRMAVVGLNWDGDRPIAEWEGVALEVPPLLDDSSDVEGPPRVKGLSLPGRRVAGTISPQVAELEELRELDLSDNHLAGAIPPELDRLTELRTLDLSDNELTGAIPSTLGNFKELRTLDLSNNKLTGAIPSTLGNLKELRLLNLDNDRVRERAHLDGPIPPELGQLANLHVLRLYGDFDGLMPPELGQLTNLLELNLRGRGNLKSLIPAELGDLSALRRLDLASNGLLGPIPPQLGGLGELEALALNDNRLSGPIPPELGNLAKLEKLVLDDNRLSGPIPPELGKLVALESLSVDGNERLSGCIPLALYHQGFKKCDE